MPKQIPIKVLDDKTLRKLKELMGDYVRRTTGKGRNTRRVETRRVAGKLYSFALTEDMGNTSPKLASCTIYTIDGTTTTEFATSQTLYDPWNVFDGAVSGATGPCVKQGGKYYAVNSSCGGA